MVSLIDIVPQKRTVQIASGELELHGLALKQIAYLLLQFPGLRNLAAENAPDLGFVELMTLMPDAVATIIAEAARQPEAADALADSNVLAPDEMLDCLKVIYDLTFPRGVVPLVESLIALGVLERRPSGMDQATNGPLKPNNSLPPDMLAAK